MRLRIAQHPEPVTARRVLAVLAVGAVVRLALLHAPRLWFDEATIGVVGLAVLRGELPIYFSGQPFMGALDAYLAAPLYLVLGVSARTVELLPVLLSLVWLGLVVRLAWEAFSPRAALFTSLVLAIPPDFLLYWSHEARTPYPLSTALGTLALLLALRFPAVHTGRCVRQGTLLGLVLGLAFWTNFLSLVYFPAVAVLLLRHGLRPLFPLLLGALPAFVVGSLPHWLYGLQHATAIPPPGRRIPLTELITHVQVVGRVSWPILAGVPADLHGTVTGVLLSAGVSLVYGVLLAVAARAVRTGPPTARAVALALLLLVVVNVAVAVGTEYGRRLDDRDQKYLLPLYTALPALVGLSLARLATPWVAATLAGGLLLLHGAGALTGSFRTLVPARAAAERAALQAELDTVAALAREGRHRLYAADAGTRVLTFLSAERVIFSNHYQETRPAYALAVDGARDVGWWTGERSPVLEANLAALGVRAAFLSAGPLGGAYVDFAVATDAVRELDPARFTVTASDNAPAAVRMVDRDAGTLWGTGRPQQCGEWIQVDLGAVVPIALVRWLPGTYQEVPAGLRLEVSLDGQAWERPIELPQYVGPLYWSAGHPMARVRSGRVELRIPPTAARYLRVTQTGKTLLRPWTIRELFVYAATGSRAVTPSADGATLAQALRAGGVTRLYADHGWGARVALADPGIRVPPANLFLDAYGFRGSGRDLLPPVQWGRGSGALLEPTDADTFARSAQVGGLGFTQREVAGLVLFVYAPVPPPPGTPLPAAGLVLTASRHPERAGLAVDGDPTTRWATAHPQTPGDWVRIDLGAPRRVGAVRLWTGNPSDWPRGLALEGSEDGASWRPVEAAVSAEGPYRWGGFTLLRDGITGVRLDVAPTTVRSLRLTLTRGDPVFDWSIHELTVYAAD